MIIYPKDLLNRPILRNFSLFIIIPICLILTVIAFRATLKWEHQKIEAGFQLAAEDRFSALEREIESNLETLLALKAFYSPSQKITRSQFRDFLALCCLIILALRRLNGYRWSLIPNGKPMRLQQKGMGFLISKLPNVSSKERW